MRVKSLGYDSEYQFGCNTRRAGLVRHDVERLKALIKRAESGEPAAIADMIRIRAMLPAR